jgi:hypothetical protein
MNKQLKKYFDYIFENSEMDTKPYDSDGAEWVGLWDGDLLIVGYPEDDDSGTWFSHGPHFLSGLTMFDMEPHDFNYYLVKYLNERYPEAEIKKIY